MSIIGNPIMAGASGPAASIFVTGLSETDTVTAVHKKTVQVPNPDYIGLPDGYTQLEYIQSTGTQYIDTGYSTENASKLQKMSFEITCAYYDIETGSTAELLNGNGNAYLGYSNGMFYAAWGRKGGILTNSTIVPNNQMHTWSVDTTAREFWFDDILVESDAVFDGSANSYGLLYLFGYSPTKLNNCRIAHAAIKYNDEFVRNFIPCRRTSDGTLGMYDTVNNAFYTNAGTGTFTAGSEIPAYIEMTVDDKTLTGKWTQKPNPAIVVPDGYTQLEYIESTGTQYINTGLNCDKYIVRAKYKYTAESYHILSAYNSSNGAFEWIGQYNNFHRIVALPTMDWKTSSSTLSIGTVYEEVSKILDGEQSLSVDGVTVINQTYSSITVPNAPVCMFAYSLENSDDFTKAIVYKLSISDKNDKQLRDFIPAKRNSDGAIGMYDLITNTFYDNSGTGTFIAGPEVPQTIDGFLIKPIRDFGTWTVTATDGSNTATQDVLVDVITEYEIEMVYKPVGALYWLGDECEDITGGWTCQAGIATSSVQKEDNSIYTDGLGDGSGSISITNNAIDLTNYSKIYAEVSDFEYGRCGPVIQVVYDSVSYSNPGTFTGCGWPQGSLGTGIIDASTINDGDISGLTGLHKIGFLVATGGAYSDSYIRGHLYKIWLE